MTCRTWIRSPVRVLVLRLSLALLPLALTACGWLSPYRIDIQQGNVVEASQVTQLRKGLTRDQVRFLLGTPLITDSFHKDRWDYVYWLDRRSTGELTRARATLFFSADGRLDHWTTEVPPGQGVEHKSRVIELSGPVGASAGAAETNK